MSKTFYVWANSLDKAIVELARGRYFNSPERAALKKQSADESLWTVTFSAEKTQEGL